MSAWTPGPWEVSPALPTRVQRTGGSAIRGHIVTVTRKGSDEDNARAEADARLIAAAPDLYQALHGLLRSVMAPEPPPGHVRDDSAQIEAARRALARARGETP